MQEEIHTDKAPKAIGPYSQAIQMAGLVMCSGQVGVDPKTGELVDGVKKQTRQAIANLREVLLAAGADLSTVLKTNVYLKDVKDFTVMNEVYAEHFKKPYPARATVGVADLPKGALVEIECMAFTKWSAGAASEDSNEGGCGGACGGSCQCGHEE